MPPPPPGCISPENAESGSTCGHYLRSPRAKSQPLDQGRLGGFALFLLVRDQGKSAAKNLIFCLPCLATTLNGAGQGLIERGFGLGVFLVGNLSLCVLHFKLEELLL